MDAPPPSRRTVAIERYDVIHRAPHEDLQALVELAAQICAVPMAAITLLTETEQHHVAAYGIDPMVCSLEDSLCHPVIDAPALTVSDVSVDPRWSANPYVVGAPAVRLYGSAPLVAPGGVQVGRLCVFDVVVRELTATQLGALETLAARVMDVLELRLRGRQLDLSLGELTGVRADLRRSNERLTRFAEQISHDLRTPLTSMLANAELLRAEADGVEGDGVTARIVEKILASGRRMNELFDRNLTFARQGGHLQRADTELAEIFHRVLTDLDPLPADVGADISFATLPRVYGDPAMLYLVALTLLTNAVRYARPGVQPRVTVDAELGPDGWRIRVRDNGSGLAAAERDRVLASAGHEDRSAQDGVLGIYGIGLASSRRIVEAHGGRMGMEEPGGPGLVVWFELPAHTTSLEPA